MQLIAGFTNGTCNAAKKEEKNYIQLEVSSLQVDLPEFLQVTFNGAQFDTSFSKFNNPLNQNVMIPNIEPKIYDFLTWYFWKDLYKQKSLFDEYSIGIKTTEGNLSGCIKIPERDSILDPQWLDTLSTAADLSVKWIGAADYYILRLFKVHFVKNNSNRIPFQIVLVYKAIIKEREASIPQTVLGNLDDKDNIAGFYLSICGVNGFAFDLATIPTNMEGNGIGYLYAYYTQKPDNSGFTPNVIILLFNNTHNPLSQRSSWIQEHLIESSVALQELRKINSADISDMPLSHH